MSELKDAPVRARPGASVQQPFARKLASAPVADGVAGAAGEVDDTIAACVETEDVIGQAVDVEEVVGGVGVFVLTLEEVEGDEGVADELPPAALAWYMFRRRPAPQV